MTILRFLVAPFTINKTIASKHWGTVTYAVLFVCFIISFSKFPQQYLEVSPLLAYSLAYLCYCIYLLPVRSHIETLESEDPTLLRKEINQMLSDYRYDLTINRITETKKFRDAQIKKIEKILSIKV